MNKLKNASLLSRLVKVGAWFSMSWMVIEPVAVAVFG